MSSKEFNDNNGATTTTTTASCSGIVELNIGGIYYTTTKSTLLRYEDSMLSLMISGNYPTSKDQNGRIFIDRDGTLFIYILNYLRTNKLVIDDLNNIDYDDITISINKLINLKTEADFYRIDTLINEIDNLLVIQREKQSKLSILNENKFNYYNLQLQNLKQQQQQQQQQSSSKNCVDTDGYHLDLIEHNFLNNNTKCLQIITHYDVFKILPLMKEDLNIIETARQSINDSQQSPLPHKLQDRHCWYLGNDCFEIQNVSYLTRIQIGHLLLQMNARLVHSNIAYLNSINNSAYNLSIFDKWFIAKDSLCKYFSNICLQQKALPPGRTVGYIDWDPQNNHNNDN